MSAHDSKPTSRDIGREEQTMTPKLMLKAQAWNAVLAWILKLRYLGTYRTKSSTKIMHAPATQAVSGRERVSEPLGH